MSERRESKHSHPSIYTRQSQASAFIASANSLLDEENHMVKHRLKHQENILLPLKGKNFKDRWEKGVATGDEGVKQAGPPCFKGSLEGTKVAKSLTML